MLKLVFDEETKARRIELKEFVGKKCKITLIVGGKKLFYTAKEVKSVTETHISFIDKFGESFAFRVSDVIEIRGEE